MLKNIPPIISPPLLKVLAEMGHGDQITIADGNFPAESMGKDCIVLRMDGHGVPEILEAILQLLPLDHYVTQPVKLMEKVLGDEVSVVIWEEYKQIITHYDTRKNLIEFIERFEFYEKVTKTYAIIATSEKAIYANIILQKGIINNH
ncbi:MAG: RbsD/FucU family protein [Brevinema sp.]